MRVLFVTPAYPPLPGGGERYVQSLAEALVEKGCELSVVTSSAEHERDFWLGSPHFSHQTTPFPVTRLPVQAWRAGRSTLLLARKAMVLASFLPWSTKFLRRAAQHFPTIPQLAATLEQLPVPDIVHVFNIHWESGLIAGENYAKRHGVPLVVTPFAHFGDQPRGRVALNSMMRHQRALLAQSSAVLLLTSAEVVGLQAWNVTPPLIEVIGGGHDPIPPLIDISHLELPKSFILFIGRASYDKGAIHAAQAVEQLLQAGESAELVMVGQTTDEWERYWQGASAELRSHIHRFGVVSEAEKHAILDRALMLLLPSQCDSFGIVLLEAWAHGKPVIGANAGGIPSVITAEHDGFLIPFGDVKMLANRIQLLLTTTTIRETMGRCGKQKLATQFNWQSVAHQVNIIYQSL